jgi:hypothetical protein
MMTDDQPLFVSLGNDETKIILGYQIDRMNAFDDVQIIKSL